MFRYVFFGSLYICMFIYTCLMAWLHLTDFQKQTMYPSVFFFPFHKGLSFFISFFIFCFKFSMFSILNVFNWWEIRPHIHRKKITLYEKPSCQISEMSSEVNTKKFNWFNTQSKILNTSQTRSWTVEAKKIHSLTTADN